MNPNNQNSARGLTEAVEFALGCFSAAYTEGLHEKMMEQPEGEPGSLRGLLERRILQAIEPLRAALASRPDAPALSEGLCVGCDHDAHASGVCSKGCECICHYERRLSPAAPLDIQAMVSRFLGWRLPDDFAPDGGICFEGGYPIGTNLFTADQAEAMIHYLLEAPAAPLEGEG